MMKRGIVVFCLCCYLANMVGFSFSLNYCDNKLAGIGFSFVNLVQWCCEEGEEDDCCDSQLVEIEKADDHTTTVVVNSAAPDFALPFSTPFTPSILSATTFIYCAGVHSNPSPADIYKQPFYILYSAFRV